MLIGAVGDSLVRRVKVSILDLIGQDRWSQSLRLESESLFVCLYDDFTTRESDSQRFWVSEDGSRAIAWIGEIYNWDKLRKENGITPNAEGLWQFYQKMGSDCLREINGAFALVLWDGTENVAFVARDKIGVFQVFYGMEDGGIVFGSKLGGVARIFQSGKEMNLSALLKYLVFCYNPGSETFYNGIRRMRPGYLLEWRREQSAVRPYWQLSFDKSSDAPEETLSEELRENLASAVRMRIKKEAETGVFLSGGLDSSSIVSLLHREGKEKISTFSFRCRGESFDESPYAKIVAETFETDHTVVEYSPEDVFRVREMVTLMDEPFCDVGINVATYLLAKAAENKIDDLFTGDGGDELFAGHPVYIADRAARLVGLIPDFIRDPLFALGRKLPDSDKKKDWKVKIKRFSKSYSFPKALGTHRWRVYYQSGELKELVSPEILHGVDFEHLFDDVIGFNQEGEGFDELGRSLYSDYQTVVQFYLRRMDMTRSLGLRPKFPMLDPDVVEFCAAIPSRLKIRGFSDTKYIEKRAVEPLLPAEIVYRKDKLGHSIPLKNWMRDEKKVKDFVLNTLSESSLRRTGIFQPDYVNRMITNHMEKRENNSHRLWALMVLDAWIHHTELI